jgi:ribosome-binding protein aMBF1 (putative translation factor)
LSSFLISVLIGAFGHCKGATVISFTNGLDEYRTNPSDRQEERPWISGGWLEKTFDAIALRRSFSQEELAAGMGVEQGYVSRLEAGKRNPTIVEIWHVAEALGVRPAALFRGRAQPSKSTAKQTKTGKPIIQI